VSEPKELPQIFNNAAICWTYPFSRELRLHAASDSQGLKHRKRSQKDTDRILIFSHNCNLSIPVLRSRAAIPTAGNSQNIS